MAAEIAVAYVSLVPSAKGLSQAIHKELVGPTGVVAGEAGHEAGTNFGNRFTSAVSTIAKAGALGLAAVGVVATKLVIDAIGGAEEARKITAQTNAVIQSTGAVANVSSRQVTDLVDALSAKAGVDDELIQSGANVLLTFTKVRNEAGLGNDIFNQATSVALDLSVALGTDLQSSVTMVGKALNDPIAGLTSLTRAGIQFTDQQKEQIKALVESGDVLGAQKIILAELTTQFGGSAEAQATATGKLKVAFDNVSEAIGGVLLPYVDQFSTWMLEKGVPLLKEELVPAVGKLAEWIKTELVPAIKEELLPRLKDLATFIRDDVLLALGEMWRIFHDDIVPVFAAVTNWIRDEIVPRLGELKDALFGVNSEAESGGPSLAGWIAALAAVGIGAGVLASSLAPLIPIIKGIGLVFGQAIAVVTYAAQFFAAVVVQTLLLSPLAKAVAAVIIFRDEVGGAFRWLYDHAIVPLGRAFEDLWGVIIRVVGGIVGFVQERWPLLLSILIAPFNDARFIIEVAWGLITGIIAGAVGAIVGFITRAWDEITGVFTRAAGVVTAIWDAQWAAIWAIVQAAWSVLSAWFSGLPGAIAGFFVTAGGWLLEGGRNVMRGLWGGISEIWTTVIAAWFLGVEGVIAGWFWGAWDWLVDAGGWIISGLKQGITNAVDAIGDFLGGIKDKIVSGFKAVFGISSPSTVMMGIGEAIMQGLLAGLFGSVGQLKDFIKNIGLTVTDLAKIVGESDLFNALAGPGFAIFKDLFGDVWGSLFGGGGGPGYGALKGLAGTERWRQTALAALAYTGQSPGWIGDLLTQMAHESGGNPNAINLNDINAQQGHPSQGLMQTIPSTFMRWAAELAGRGITDPFANIVAAIRYTVARYGSLGAWRQRGFKGYGTGGVASETGLAYLHAGEGVFTPDQIRVLGAAIGGHQIVATTLEAGLARVVAAIDRLNVVGHQIVDAVHSVDSSILFAGNTINRTLVHATNLITGRGPRAENWANPIAAWSKELAGFQGGGVVSRTGPAFLHGGETVFTPEQMQVLGAAIATGGGDLLEGGGRGVVVVQNNNGITDYAELARRSADEIAWTMRVAG